MCRREMEKLPNEKLEAMQTGSGATSHEAFLAQVILFNREAPKNDDDFWYWFASEDVDIFNHLQYPKRGDYSCRIDD